MTFEFINKVHIYVFLFFSVNDFVIFQINAASTAVPIPWKWMSDRSPLNNLCVTVAE